MSYPILGISGPAGAGKDAVAAAVAKAIPTVNIALADVMKRMAAHLFGFTEDQLWGPSSARNAIDPKWTPERIASMPPWDWADLRLVSDEQQAPIRAMLQKLFPVCRADEDESVFVAFTNWYNCLRTTMRARAWLAPRLVLQTLGTEFGRAVDANVWVDYTLRQAQELLSSPTKTYDRTKGVVERPAHLQNPTSLVTVSDVRFRNEVLAIRALGGHVWRVQAPEADAEAAEATARAGAGAQHASEAEMAGIPGWWFSASLLNDKSQGLAVLQDRVARMVDDEFLRGPQGYST
jgi:hypothetical protein